MKNKATRHTAFAGCTIELQADGTAIQLLPAGSFKARDGRSHDVATGHWLMNATIAAQVMALAATRTTDFVIDYEHQTLNSEKNGLPAPAAGWFKGAELEWREGQRHQQKRGNSEQTHRTTNTELPVRYQTSSAL